MQKGQTHTVGYAVGAQYAVGTQYVVGLGAKRSTHTVDLANMGGGDRQTHRVGYAVDTQYAAVHSMQ